MRLFCKKLCFGLLAATLPGWAASAPSLNQLLAYPYVSGLVASETGKQFAWVEDVRGVRNIWCAGPEDRHPRRLTHYTEDDGQELTQLMFSADATHLLFVRGGDHDANWAAEGNLAPNPDNSPTDAKVAIWSVTVTEAGGSPVLVAEGDSPALSARGVLAFVKKNQIWTAPLPGQDGSESKGHLLFFDRGKDEAPVWSKDGTRLAFVSGREDHSFVGIYTTAERPLVYLSPSTDYDSLPVWSPDGSSIAYMRQPSHGNGPQNFLVQRPKPFSFWIADAGSGQAHAVWSSPDTLAGSLPDLAGDEPLHWMADNKLVFLAETDDWPHLYAIDIKGGNAHLLTPGKFMVETVVEAADHRSLVYSANKGVTADDEDRRHLFRVGTDGHAPVTLTKGTSIEWSPVALAGDGVAFVAADAQRPAAVAVLAEAGEGRVLDTGSAGDYPSSALVTPRLVSFRSPDGLTVQGQLFRQPGAGQQPGVIFVHGGPPRQMLLGWHYMQYYSNAYAVNQYLASHGFTVLSVNYRLGIGYGRAFQHPPHAGPAGAAEYQDVLAGARCLQHVAGVDAHRIGIWGGSYGGYLTGLALARNSDVFRTGVDFHGLSNWVPALAKDGAFPEQWYQAGADWKQAAATAFAASPDADIARWKSPVLLIQGDDDRNVPFDQTVELAYRLRQQHTPFEELIIPNEIHGFLRMASWLHADEATVEYLARQLGRPTSPN